MWPRKRRVSGNHAAIAGAGVCPCFVAKHRQAHDLSMKRKLRFDIVFTHAFPPTGGDSQ
jgi:hypothetical protein